MPFNEWVTPKEYIDLVKMVMGDIELDAASNDIAQGYVNAHRYYGLDNNMNALTLPWNARHVYLNPPYSAGDVDNFIHKAVNEWKKGYIEQMIVLVNASVDTEWYHNLLAYSSCLLLVRGRIKFWKIENGKAYERWEGQVSKAAREQDPTLKAKIGNSPRYLNSLFYFGRTQEQVNHFCDVFELKGTIVRRA